MFFLQTACNDNSDSCKKILFPKEDIGSQKYIDLESSDSLKVNLFRGVPVHGCCQRELQRIIGHVVFLFPIFSGGGFM